MAQAEPYPLPEVSEEDLRAFAEGVAGQIAGPADEGAGQADAGGLPAGGTAQATTDEQTLAGGYGYPAPFTRFEVPFPYTDYPFVTVGKVFFTQNGSRYVASAASIGNYAILTAGHVVHAGDGKPTGWSTDLIFVPAYKDNAAPLGQWKASWLATRTTWYNNGNPGAAHGGHRRGSSANAERPQDLRRCRLARFRLELATRAALVRVRVPRRGAVQRAATQRRRRLIRL